MGRLPLGYSNPKKKKVDIGPAVIEKKPLEADIGRAKIERVGGELSVEELNRRRDALMNSRLATAAKEKKKLTTTYLVKHGKNIAARSRSY